MSGRRSRPFASSTRIQRAIIRIAVFLAATFAYALPSCGASPGLTAGASDPQTGPIEGSADHVRITTIKRASGGDDSAVVVVVIDPGYHINANPASQDYLIATVLNITNRAPLRVIYPEPVRFRPKFAGDVLNVYEGTIRIIAEFPRGSLTPEDSLFGTLTVQACTEEMCLPPADLALPGR